MELFNKMYKVNYEFSLKLQNLTLQNDLSKEFFDDRFKFEPIYKEEALNFNNDNNPKEFQKEIYQLKKDKENLLKDVSNLNKEKNVFIFLYINDLIIKY